MPGRQHLLGLRRRAEVHESAGSATLSARRSRSTGPVSVPLASRDLTARLGVDYGPGDDADTSIAIPILHDGLSGADRAFRVLLGPASGGAVAMLLGLACAMIGLRRR